MINLSKNIVLLGLMGVGKTTIGKAFAAAHNLRFIDMDEEIVREQKMTIPHIFAQKGETFFREVERDLTIRTVKESKNSVISLGGGAFMNEETRGFIKDQAMSVFMKADIDTLLRRVGNGEGRPLLKDNAKAKLGELIALRYPVYKEADITLNCFDEPPEETVNRLYQALYNHNALS